MATIEHGALTIESNHESVEDMRAAMAPSQEKPAAGEAAADDAAEGASPDDGGAADDGAAVAAGSTPAQKPRNRRDDPRKAVETAVGKQRTAERERDEAKAEAKRLADALEAAKAPAAAAAKPAAGTAATEDDPNRPVTQAEYKRYRAMPDAPKADDFEDHDDFVVAMGLFVTDQRWKENNELQEAATFEKNRQTTWATRLADARKNDPDFDKKIDQTTPATQQMKDIIADSEVGPAMLVHLCANKALAQRISTLHPSLVDREMGKIEGQLLAAPAASTGTAVPPVISSAKRPHQPVGGSQKQVSDDDGDEADLPVEDFISRGNKREGRPALRS